MTKMTKFEISWTEEVWKKVTIEAGNEDVAKAIFWSTDFDPEDITITGVEIQEGIDIEEVED